MNPSMETYALLFERDLKKAMHEVSLYKNDADLWQIREGISNSGGNLIMHLIGNLRHFIGHVLGGTDFERNRSEEFKVKDVSREELLQDLEKANQDIQKTLAKLSENQLMEKYPLKVLGYEMTTAHFIAHLYGHLTYHLGQINYHRRLIG